MAEQQGEFAYEDVYVYEAADVWIDKALSALAVTSSGDVYGAGYNSLVRTAVLPSKYPMLEGGADKLDKWIKVTQLCGLGIRKIVVGKVCAAALTQANEVLIWGNILPRFIDEESVVVVQGYQPNVRCEICPNNHDYTAKVLGGAELSYCENIQLYPTRIFPCTPQDNLPVRRFVRTGGRWGCGKCGKTSTNSAVLEVNSISLRYCRPCDLLWDLNFNSGLVVREDEGNFFRTVSLVEGIVDADFDYYGLWILTASSKLKLSAYADIAERLGGNSRDFAWMELPFVIPHNVKLKAVHVYSSYFSFLVETSDGALLRGTPLVSPEGNIYWGFKDQIILPAPVTKVCATLVKFVCILSDKSVWIISDMYPPKRLIISRNGTSTDIFLGIAATKALDTIYVRDNESSLSDVYNFQGTEIITCETDCNKVITELVCSSPIPSRSETSTSTRAELPASASTSPLATSSTRAELPASASTSPLATSSTRAELPASASTSPLATSSTSPTEDSSSSSRLPVFQVQLYGQKQLSDMTFTLSDGDFPAHRCVLMTTSAYFQKMLSTETATTHVTRDASTFNPKAYKCLLKYFYQQQPDELDLDGLFDLYQLADSYEEEQIIKDTARKIKSKINRYSVSHIFAMSKLFGLDEVEKYCEKILRTTEFKDQLLEKFIQDPITFLLH